ncbi:RNA polymerase sigma factor [Actinoplanes philippinensis]|uniref:RNA polymerase sigma factor, sigma-70 family n=1 Tax=Actinoplanes philippinensis TaxID=35752 RepID=A0A1I2HZR9_9ACTN|nr:sigma-70 family RNA polymerase sigma factor [Actinoplanes philippinensis]GIE78775.1 RNA polymerase sigma factor [Actinoplanes philippinensis]SFF35645.1 RNA polymerase sigma factor, sigma-70 family [Actinoplanes philippinensis]
MNESFDVTDLVAAAVDGDEAAWKDLVARFTPLVASVAHGFRLHGTDVDDVAQTVWLRLLEHLGELREPRALPMWIITTSRNECLRQVRATQRTRPYDPLADTHAGDEPLSAAPAGDPDEHLIRVARHQALLAGLAVLPDHQRELLLLLIEDPQPSYAEISRRLNIRIGSIGPTRARALERLRACPHISGMA